MTVTANSLQLALLSAAILGFRHGFDYDHIAAISDITSVQTSRWRGMRLGLLYALGHAAMVAALGSAVIIFQLSLPHGIDRIAERLVGLTLLILGVYVLGSLFNGNPAPRSRFHVMAGALRWAHWKVKSYWHDHDLPRPADKTWNYSSKSVLMIGGQDLELQFEVRAHDRGCAWARRGDAQPTDDLLADSQSWRNQQGLCRLDDVYRGTAGDEYGDDGVGGGTLRLQFAAARLSVCSHRANRDL